MPTRSPAWAKARLSGRPTWPPPPRTTTSRSAGGWAMDTTLPARCVAMPPPAWLAVRTAPSTPDRFRERHVCCRSVSRPGHRSRGRALDSMIQAARKRDLDLIGVLVAVGLSAAVISTNLGAMLSAYDGGISSSAATFTLLGLLSYRDYWLLYGPLSGFLLAILSAILGPSVE